MKVEHPQAFRFIMQDEIYLLDQDKGVKSIPAAINETPAQAPEAAVPVVQTPPVTFNYLGENIKRFLILVNYTNQPHIAPAHLTALENIVKRKDLSIADVAILNTHTYPGVSIAELNEYFNPDKLLILGAGALPAGMNKPAINEAMQTGNYQTLYSFSFDEMMDSNDNKKAFWEQMKKL